jgi:hypothetical protein
MRLYEEEFDLRLDFTTPGVFERLSTHSQLAATADQVPIRFVVTGPSSGASSAAVCHCEVGFLSELSESRYAPPNSIFRFRRRLHDCQEAFTAVLLVPAGIGAEIGGHAGDATPAAKTLAAVCDRLIVHPNVVNASDINEMTANMEYVEGSVISRLLMGTVCLVPTRRNRILTVVQQHEEKRIVHHAINAVNAAKAAGGFACTGILALSSQMQMAAHYSSSGRAMGTVSRFDILCDLVAEHRAAADAVAIATVVDVAREDYDRYYDHAGDDGDAINPWGGVESLLTHGLSTLFDIPTAHSPMYERAEFMDSDAGVMSPAKAAEGVSLSFMHCLFKGLSASPGIVADPSVFGHRGVISVEDISCLITPAGCLGLPVLAALHQGIAVIEVQDSRNVMRNALQDLPWKDGQFVQVENYLEAAGMVAAMRAGVAPDTLKRPLDLVRGSGIADGEHELRLKRTPQKRSSLR